MIYNPIPERFLSTTKMIREIPLELQNIICEYHTSHHNWEQFYSPLVNTNYPFIEQILNFMVDEDCCNYETTPMEEIFDIVSENTSTQMKMMIENFECKNYVDEDFGMVRKNLVNCFVSLLTDGWNEFDFPSSFDCYENEELLKDLKRHITIKVEEFTDSSLRVHKTISFLKITHIFLHIFITQLVLNTWETFYQFNRELFDTFALFVERTFYATKLGKEYSNENRI